jgi:hypothetical protein
MNHIFLFLVETQSASNCLESKKKNLYCKSKSKLLLLFALHFNGKLHILRD